MARRYRIEFPNVDSYRAALPPYASGPTDVETSTRTLTYSDSNLLLYDPTDIRSVRAGGPAPTRVQVRNDKRLFFSVASPPMGAEDVESERALDLQLEHLIKDYGARIVEDFQYFPEDSFDSIFEMDDLAPEDPDAPTLDDVLEMISATDAWSESKGDGVVIAVVDRGINGSRPEFPHWKRKGQWAPMSDDAWVDASGHGTMCACIASGTRADGGEFDGVAPNASIISCKTPQFHDSDLATIYDYLTDLVREKSYNIIATNSFGWQGGSPPDAEFMKKYNEGLFKDALNEALEAGIKVFFSAGNYHREAGGGATSCSPNSVWLPYKCRSDIMTVGACDIDSQIWYYSSRGPGEHYSASDPNTNSKPDVIAPTPRGGRILYGNSVKAKALGWGTSGACPQVAGLAALLLAKNQTLSANSLFDVIRSSADTLPGYSATCVGTGIINCERALTLV